MLSILGIENFRIDEGLYMGTTTNSILTDCAISLLSWYQRDTHRLNHDVSWWIR